MLGTAYPAIGLILIEKINLITLQITARKIAGLNQFFDILCL